MKRLALSIASLVLSTATVAANITTEIAAPTDKINVISISGEIVKGDYNQFIKATNGISNGKPIFVFLEGPGGALVDGLEIGLEIYKRKYTTVAYGGVCASACAYIWLAGERVIIDERTNAKIGFHAPYYMDKFGNKKSDNLASAMLGGYLKEIGADYTLIAYATSVDGNSIRWLTESAAKEIGLSAEFYKKPNTVQTEQTKLALQNARNEIIRTQEYNRVFKSQLDQLVANSQPNGSAYLHILKSMSQNDQYIRQQQEIINRLQGK